MPASMPRNRAASRKDPRRVRMASAARCANEDPDNNDVRPSENDNGGATDSVDERMTGNNKGRQSGPCTRAGQGNQLASRVDCSSALRASAARYMGKDTDNSNARPSDDSDGGATNSIDRLMTNDDQDK